MLSVLAWPGCLMRNFRRVSLRLSTVLLILESVAFAGVIRDAILYCNVQQRVGTLS